VDAAELRTFLSDKFNETELRTLAFDLQIPFEDLGGADSGKNAHIQALIEWCVRRNRLDALSKAANDARTAVSTRPYAASGPPMLDWGPATQLERLLRHMDEMREDVAQLVTKTEVLAQRMGALERRLEQIEQHLPPQPVGWQTWVLAIVGLLMAVVMVMSLVQLLTGGH
jgi:hypothetical protein